QAVYGIRDFHVTGVQTCALPISRGGAGICRPRGKRRVAVGGNESSAGRDDAAGDGRRRGTSAASRLAAGGSGAVSLRGRSAAARSEERRVGKECRCQRRPGSAAE